MLVLGLAVTPAWAQVRVVPTTTYSRGLLTNTTAAASRTYLGVGAASGGSFTNGTFVGGTFSLTTNTDLTASRVLVSDSAKRITNSTTTSTELGYLSGATSSIQTQLDAKGAATNGTFSGGTFAGATNTNPQIVGGTASQLAISGQAVVTSTNASITPFVIVGAAGQTANAFTIQTNGGTVQMLVTKEGAMGIGGASTSYKLQITGAGSYNTLGGCAIGMHNTTASQIWAQAAHNDTAFFWQDVTGNQTKMSIYPGANGALDFYTGTGYTTINGTGGLKVVGKTFVGGTSTPQYQVDVNGQARLIGTNGINFGGTSGAADKTVTIHQSSANNLLLTATTTTTSGDFVIGTKVKITTLAKTANYTLTSTDPGIIFADATGGAVTITLPAASSSTIGCRYEVFKVDSSANAVTIAGNGADTLLTGSTTSTTAQANCLKVTGYTSTSWIVNKTQ